MSSWTQCLVGHSVWLDTVSSWTQCLVGHIVWLDTVWLDTLSGWTQCLVGHIVWLDTVSGWTVWCCLCIRRTVAVDWQIPALAVNRFTPSLRQSILDNHWQSLPAQPDNVHGHFCNIVISLARSLPVCIAVCLPLGSGLTRARWVHVPVVFPTRRSLCMLVWLHCALELTGENTVFLLHLSGKIDGVSY